jgi:hypothetical protein
MDLAKDINKIVLYWVTKVEPYTKNSNFLWGTPISGDDGLGQQTASHNGSVAFITFNSRRFEQDLSLARGHENRKGFFLIASSASSISFPDTPFLITDHLNMNFLRKQEISFTPSREWEELEGEVDRLIEHWVCTSEWIALLQIDTKKSNRKALLWIFSDRSEVSISANTLMHFCDNPEDSYGMITGTSN